MQNIKDTVQEVMQTWEAQKTQSPASALEILLKKNLTKKERGHIKFSSFRKGALNITVDSAVWLYQLSLKKENLLGKLSKKNSDIRDIRFYLGEIG